MDKRLYLSRNNKIVAGVCGGIGEYFNIDPTLIRVLLVLLIALTRVTFIVIYIFVWAIIPIEP